MAREVEIRAPVEQTEGTRSQVQKWLKAVGDTVAENEPLIEIETDKVTVEIASPGSGTLREIIKQEQDEIGPGDLLGRIEAEGEAVSAGAPSRSSGQPLSVGTRAESSAFAADGGSTEGNRSSQMGASVPSGSRALTPSPGASAARSFSPAVRRLLAERDLDASEVRGTGQGGRITVEDIMAHGGVAGASQPTSTATATATATFASTTDLASAASTTPSHRVPHTATRKRIAEHMVQSLLQTAPHVTTVFEADLTAVLEHRRRNKDEFASRGAPLTLTAYFLQATVAAIRAVPEANSRWTDTAVEVFDFMHIGVATALAAGLVVPVLRDVQSRDFFETAKGLEDLVSRAREGRLSPTDVRGGTFTISNHGVSGSLVATPIIINQPQAAILGVGKLEKRPVVVSDGGEDRIAIRPRCYVTLTIDHRVMDGHQANRFLQTFVERLLAWPP